MNKKLPYNSNTKKRILPRVETRTCSLAWEEYREIAHAARYQIRKVKALTVKCGMGCQGQQGKASIGVLVIKGSLGNMWILSHQNWKTCFPGLWRRLSLHW